MYPTTRQLLDEAAPILDSSPTHDMYAHVLATSIAGQLNERVDFVHYQPPSAEELVAVLERDERYTIQYRVGGLPIVGRR